MDYQDKLVKFEQLKLEKLEQTLELEKEKLLQKQYIKSLKDGEIHKQMKIHKNFVFNNFDDLFEFGAKSGLVSNQIINEISLSMESQNIFRLDYRLSKK